MALAAFWGRRAGGGRRVTIFWSPQPDAQNRHVTRILAGGGGVFIRTAWHVTSTRHLFDLNDNRSARRLQ